MSSGHCNPADIARLGKEFSELSKSVDLYDERVTISDSLKQLELLAVENSKTYLFRLASSY
jgi:hypothetical protein